MSRLTSVPSNVLLRRSERLETLYEQVRKEAHAISTAVELLVIEQANRRLALFIETPAVQMLVSRIEERMQDIDMELMEREFMAEEHLVQVRAA